MSTPPSFFSMSSFRSFTTKTDNLSIMTINLQSITNKGTELCNIISSSSPEIIIGTETHLDPTYNNAEILPYDIPRYYYNVL
jgi:hypothetical protein